jgi:molecular chaperone DnaJ
VKASSRKNPAGKGEAPPGGGLSGDLFITVHVARHPHLTRAGDDVRSRLSISFTDAALGTTREVETLKGTATVDVPPGTQPETELRLASRGFPKIAGRGQGDHLVTVGVTIPKRLSRQQRKLLEELSKIRPKKLFG